MRVLRFAQMSLLLALHWPAMAGDQATIVDHPSKLVYPELEFTPPERDKYRHVLPCGVVVYVVEDHDLPLIDLSVTVRTGRYLEPKGKEGLSELAGSQMRAGGTAKSSPDDFDEEVAFLAANLNSSIGDTEGSASFNCLTPDLDRVLELFFDMLRTPRFDSSRLDLRKSQQLQDLARRNDQTPSIENREWERLLRGPDFFSVDRVTKASIEGIQHDDLVAFHRRYFRPKNFIVAVSGDASTQKILEKLEAKLAPWAKDDALADPVPPVPKPSHQLKPGLYLVDKPSVNQGRVSIGHVSTTRDNPDYHALYIMNHILGGGGFTSRITSRVRSDKGLAYTAGSRFEFGVYYDGIFRALFQSKSESVAEATAIVLEEISKLRSEKVSKDELETAVNYAIGVFPRFFATAQAIASTLASDEFSGRDPAFWRTYRQKMKAVTEEDVLRVAKKYLHPEQWIILAVGNAAEILKGNASTPERSLEKLAGPAGIRRIPLPDPLTLEYGT